MLKYVIWSCCGLLALSQATLFAGKKKENAVHEKNQALSLEHIVGKLREASRHNKIDIIRQFARGVDLNTIRIGKRKRTLLHVAAGYGSLPIVQSLLSRGMDPNAKDATGHTPLMYAAQHNFRLSAAVLLGHGANPREMNPDGATPLLLSPLNRAFIKTFRKNAARKSKECIVCFDPKKPDEHRMTNIECLHTICEECKSKMLHKRLFNCPMCRREMDAIDPC